MIMIGIILGKITVDAPSHTGRHSAATLALAGMGGVWIQYRDIPAYQK